MANELLLKIGNSGSWVDGQVIAVKDTGYLISGTAITAWIDESIVPTKVNTMPGYLRRRVKRRILKLRYALTHTNEEVALNLLEISPEDLEEQIDEAIETKQQAVIDRAKLEEFGLDTNWGIEDLKIHAVVLIEDVTLNEIEGLLEEKREVGMIGKKQGRRKKRFRYETLVGESEKSDMRNKRKYVPVNRTRTPLNKSKIEDV